DAGAIRVVEKKLPRATVGEPPAIVGKPACLELRDRRGESVRRERHVIDHPGFQLAGRPATDDVQDRLAVCVEPCAGKIERRPRAGDEPEEIAIEARGRVHVVGQNREVIHGSCGHGRLRRKAFLFSFYASASRTKSAIIALASGPCASFHGSVSSPPLQAWPSAATATQRTASRPSRRHSRVVVIRPPSSPCCSASEEGWL